VYDTGCYRVYRRAELVRATIIAMEKRDFAVLVFQGDFSETTCQVPVEIFVSTVDGISPMRHGAPWLFTVQCSPSYRESRRR